jgi:hypothetical protein
VVKLPQECTDAAGRCRDLFKKVRVGRPGHDDSFTGGLSGSSPYLTEEGAEKFAKSIEKGGAMNVGVKKKGHLWYVSSGRKPKPLMPRRPQKKASEPRKLKKRALFAPRRRR